MVDVGHRMAYNKHPNKWRYALCSNLKLNITRSNIEQRKVQGKGEEKTLFRKADRERKTQKKTH